MMTTASVRPASTVVLLRDRDQLEVFLVRRHDHLRFMGGAHVFPGGSVDDTDFPSRTADVCDAIEAGSMRMPDIPPELAVAFHVAAVRELFEEAGVLLARRAGAFIDVNAAARSRLDSYRLSLSEHHFDIRDVAEREAIRLALDALVYFAHWVTPDGEARRFDTRFFLAVAPDDQDATHCEHETTGGLWLSPAEALARCRAGDIVLPPPTWTTLRQIEPHASAADAMAWAAGGHVRRVKPEVIERGNARVIALPGDPLHPAPESVDTPERRFLLADGRWEPVGPDDPRAR